MQGTVESKISWFHLFALLKRKGWSLYRIETHTGIPKSTMLGWSNGAEPKHSDGETLIALWLEVTGESRDDLPTERKYPSRYRLKCRK